MPQPKHLTPLGHRIDFEALITVDSANPNGDPMKKGLPRTDSSGRGVISAVCIRRKLRNALAELGQPILISPPERPGDDLARRLSALPGNCDIPAEACRRWFDVRAFGQVFSSRGMHAPGVRRGLDSASGERLPGKGYLHRDNLLPSEQRQANDGIQKQR